MFLMIGRAWSLFRFDENLENYTKDHFKNQLVAVGGCNGGICHNNVEFYDGSIWSFGESVPLEEIYSHALTTDQESIYLFSGLTSNPENVLRYQNGTWSTIGKLLDTRYWNNSAIQLGHFVYTGRCSLEKVTVVEKFQTEVVISDEGECQLDLYYATMLEFPNSLF